MDFLQQFLTTIYASPNRFNPRFFLECANKTTLEPLTFSQWQLDICDYIFSSIQHVERGDNLNIFISLAGARGCGKTILAAFLSLWSLVVFSDRKAIVRLTANTETQVRRVLIATVTNLMHRLALDFFISQHSKLAFSVLGKPENTIEGIVWSRSNPVNIRGEHADFSLRIFDEATGIQDEVFHTILSGLVSGINIVLLTGNPICKHGFFYEAFTGACGYPFFNRNISAFDCIHINTESEAFKLHESALKMSDPTGDLYNIEILGQFPDSGVDVFFSEVKIAEQDLRYMPAVAGTLGVDIATGEGADMTVITNQDPRGQLFVRYRGRIDMLELANMLVDYAKYVNAISLDAVAIGTALRQTLNARGVRTTPVLGQTPSSNRKFLNKRVELYGELRDFLNNGGEIVVPFGMKEIITAEIRMIRSEFTDDGRLKLIPKKDMPFSPDILDALSYTFAVKTRHLSHFRAL